ncbi:RNA-directed DNA polymerase, eukaryota, reverse transcriptase zinc-binding domain protein, partial [Tanacetum coccineum]
MNMGMESNPVLVLDESCVNQQVYAYCLLGKVKEFASLTNLKVVLVSKGFNNVKLKYMGGFWVMLEFSSEEVKMKFQSSVGIGTWFSQLQQASSDFIIDGREERCFHGKRVCINTTGYFNILESFKIIYQGKAYWVRAKEIPGWVPDFVDENDEVDESDDESFEGEPNGDNLNNGDDVRGENEIDEVPDNIFEEKLFNTNDDESSDADSLKYPPGFTPQDDIEGGEVQSIKRNVLVNERDKGTHNIHEEVEASRAKKSYSKKNSKGGCALVGNSSGILCVWDSNSLKKLNTIVSDYFVLIRGVWVPNGKHMLIISVYAPQKLSEKKMLWDYLSHVIANWKVDGFVKLVEETWNEAPGDTSNAILNLMKKSKFLKKKIRAWNIEKKKNSKTSLLTSKLELVELDAIIDKADLEIEVTNEEIKRAVWDCGVDKSPGPDGFTFGFYRRFWKLIENDVVDAVKLFFHHGFLPKGSNSSFIALILKTPDANMVKDFRPISLIGSFYKIIAKILENRLVVVLGDIVNEVQSAFVADRQILDGPFILNELFQCCKSKKNQSMIFNVDFEKAFYSVRWDYLDDVLKKFGFGEKWCGWIQGFLRSTWGSGDQLSPFLFILIMESLHISFQRVMDAGQWNDSNIDTIVNILDCFYHASGLRINMSKSKLMRISVDKEKVDQVASKIGCVALKSPFSYLGSKIVPMKVLQRMESIRCHFFNGTDLGGKKSMWVKWKNVLASKGKGGLGVSSLYVLNRALMFKWVWWFITQRTSLWTRVIKLIHRDDGKISKTSKAAFLSIWLDIVHEMGIFKKQGIDVYSFIHKKLGNGKDAAFWEEVWREDEAFKYKFPRLCALETCKGIDIAAKLTHRSLDYSFRRDPRGVDVGFRGLGRLSVASVRKLIDDKRLPDVSSKTRWIKAIPIKAPPSLDYVPGPEHPPLPDYVPGAEEPEQAPLLPCYPLPTEASPTTLSPGYVADFNPEEDPEEDPKEDPTEYLADGGDDDYDDDDDDEGDGEEEEHLALAYSTALHTVDPISSAEDTEAFKTDES